MSQPGCELRSTAEIGKLFIVVTAALCITRDGINRLPEGFRIRSHDFHSSIPNLEVDSPPDKERVLDRIRISVARLGAMVRSRRELSARVHDCKSIIPTSTGKGTGVGIRTEGRIIQASGGNTYQACQKLNRKIAELLLQAA